VSLPVPLAKVAASLALLGGVLWIVHALLGGGDDPLLSTLHFVGLACLLVASAVFGTTLVRSDALAMRAVVALASALLTLSLIEAFRPADNVWYDGSWGVVAAVLGGLALARRRGDATGRTASGADAR
jgi:MYXO-CTERM domain-containing protein